MKLAHASGFVLTLAAAAAAAVAQESHGGGGGGEERPFLLEVDPGAAIWNLLMFLGLLFILGKFVWPHILHGLQAREDRIREDLRSAEESNTRAHQTLEEHRKQLDQAHAEARGLIDQARQDAEAARQRMMADTERELDRMRRRGVEEIEHARHAAVQDLHAQAGQLAVAVATKILQRQVTEEDTARLVDQSLEEMDQLSRTA